MTGCGRSLLHINDGPITSVGSSQVPKSPACAGFRRRPRHTRHRVFRGQEGRSATGPGGVGRTGAGAGLPERRRGNTHSRRTVRNRRERNDRWSRESCAWCWITTGLASGTRHCKATISRRKPTSSASAAERSTKGKACQEAQWSRGSEDPTVLATAPKAASVCAVWFDALPSPLSQLIPDRDCCSRHVGTSGSSTGGQRHVVDRQMT